MTGRALTGLLFNLRIHNYTNPPRSKFGVSDLPRSSRPRYKRLGSSNVQHLDAKYERYWGNIDFGQKWQITIAQGGSQKSMVLENFQPFLARAKKKPYPAELERLGCLVWDLRTKVTGEPLEQNYGAGCRKLGY
jgi:hypothetical protein